MPQDNNAMSDSLLESSPQTARLRRAHRDHGRATSLSGGFYVGRRSVDGGSPTLGSGEPHIAVHGLGLPFDREAAAEGDVFDADVPSARPPKPEGWRRLKARFASALGRAEED